MERAGRGKAASCRNHDPEYKLLKWAAVIMVCIVLFAGLTIVQSSASGVKAEPAGVDEKLIVVSSGETLWDIAFQNSREGTDVRKSVYLIKKRNNLSSSSIEAGQSLIIPAL